MPSSATLQHGLEGKVAGPLKRPVFMKGEALVIVRPRKDTAPILLRLVEALPTTVAAVSGDRAAALALDLGA